VDAADSTVIAQQSAMMSTRDFAAFLETGADAYRIER